ncbi:hypothetical protein F5884DRAFT_899531 [Xylogone sp. PMI_703]|nr:hypothetical protein F5884DRAFT_899531 [Xylogone sp. PMI_703]
MAEAAFTTHVGFEGLQLMQSMSGGIGWEHFDHSQSLILSDDVFIAYLKEHDDYYVLQSCLLSEFILERAELIQMAWIYPSFVSTKCVFRYNDKVYVGQEKADMCLMDIISCTISLKENHVSAILSQIIHALDSFYEETSRGSNHLIYGSLRAHNVFVTKDGKVKLGSFGKGICPKKTNTENLEHDRQDIGYLAIHMISRTAPVPARTQEEISRLFTDIKNLLIFDPSPEFLDFLHTSLLGQGGIKNLLKHPFLKNTSKKVHLGRLVHNAERLSARSCEEVESLE